MPSPRRFPPHWTLDEMNDACFIVRDASGRALAYVYFEESRDGVRRPCYSPRTRPGASPPTSPSCRICCASNRNRRGHSTTSSASASILSEMLRPSAFAVLRLMTKSNLVGCSTGRSPALLPRKILST
jgi:hypothetical protein